MDSVSSLTIRTTKDTFWFVPLPGASGQLPAIPKYLTISVGILHYITIVNDVDIITSPTTQHVMTRPAYQHVVALPANQGVITSPPLGADRYC
ncbi:hypothetical protein XACG117_990009 [Xanthomonas citri pv. citri]|nr:hypothetical protein XACG117_990009 [Xanthomonas citri pv. citri]